ncbi:MAG: hypothetical protein QXT33_04945 [Thermofilum sp.]
MPLFRKRRARILIQNDGLRAVVPCDSVDAIREWVRELEAQGEECRVSLKNVDLEELLEKLHELGLQAVLEAVGLEVRGSSGVLVCPVCLSASVRRVDVVGLMPPVYVCEKCGYKGSLLLEVEGSSR